MEDNRDRPPNAQPRRFVYRDADPDAGIAHPLRRATDNQLPSQAISRQPSPNTQLLKFRVYLKVN